MRLIRLSSGKTPQTGHSSKSVQTIINHYLGSAAELADAGIDKLVAWMQREGIAI